MSTPAPVLVTGVGTLAVTTQPLPSTNASQASISLVVTDAAGTVYPAVVLTGAESPPWSWAATYASGQATAAETDLDTNGATIATAGPWSFMVTPVVAATFEQGAGVTFVASTTSAAVAAQHASLKK
jgi:hypothetical protein